jgi:ribose/xylose/arabinose/galactoside ABC-type transport system permease subunit
MPHQPISGTISLSVGASLLSCSVPCFSAQAQHSRPASAFRAWKSNRAVSCPCARQCSAGGPWPRPAKEAMRRHSARRSLTANGSAPHLFTHLAVGVRVGAAHGLALVLEDLNPFVFGTKLCHLVGPGIQDFANVLRRKGKID